MRLKGLLIVGGLGVSLGNLEALLGRVKDGLDGLDETVLLLLEFGVLLDSALNKNLNVAQLVEVEVTLALQAADGLLQSCDLLLESLGGGRVSSGGSSSDTGTTGGGGATGTSRGSRTGGGARGTAHGGRESATLATGSGIVITAGVVLVPEFLGPLQEVEVVLHLAFYERLDGDGLFDLVLGEGVWRKAVVSNSTRCAAWQGIRLLTLEDLEVLNVGIFRVHVELDAGHGNIAEDAVVDLAEGGAVAGRGRLAKGALVQRSGAGRGGWRWRGMAN